MLKKKQKKGTKRVRFADDLVQYQQITTPGMINDATQPIDPMNANVNANVNVNATNNKKQSYKHHKPNHKTRQKHKYKHKNKKTRKLHS